MLWHMLGRYFCRKIKYGAWQIYKHLYKENFVSMDYDVDVIKQIGKQILILVTEKYMVLEEVDIPIMKNC